MGFEIPSFEVSLRDKNLEMLAPSITALHDLETGAAGFIRGARAVFVELARAEARKAAEKEAAARPTPELEAELELLEGEPGELKEASFNITREELRALLDFFTKHTKNIPGVGEDNVSRFWEYLSHTELLLVFGQYMVEYQKLHKL